VPRASRLDRRKARTRQALIDAAVRLIAEGRGDRASIAEITEEADIGFGSFYNHFDSKEQLFGTASGELLEQWGQVIDQACADISDPAEVFAVSLRISGRLGWTHPDIARFLTGVGLESVDASRGLAPRALRDIRAGQAAGCFTITDAQIALSAVAGGLLGLLRSRERHPERVDETSVDQLTEACLRLLGARTHDRRIMRSALANCARPSCAIGTCYRTDGARCAAVSRRPGPRSGPRWKPRVLSGSLLYVTSWQPAPRAYLITKNCGTPRLRRQDAGPCACGDAARP
jgi:AcrR family transcriptional regulator